MNKQAKTLEPKWEIILGGRRRGGGRMMGVIKVHCVGAWNCHNEIHHFVRAKNPTVFGLP
jgi:hypothetical protein